MLSLQIQPVLYMSRVNLILTYLAPTYRELSMSRRLEKLEPRENVRSPTGIKDGRMRVDAATINGHTTINTPNNINKFMLVEYLVKITIYNLLYSQYLFVLGEI